MSFYLKWKSNWGYRLFSKISFVTLVPGILVCDLDRINYTRTRNKNALLPLWIQLLCINAIPCQEQGMFTGMAWRMTSLFLHQYVGCNYNKQWSEYGIFVGNTKPVNCFNLCLYKWKEKLAKNIVSADVVYYFFNQTTAGLTNCKSVKLVRSSIPDPKLCGQLPTWKTRLEA